MAKKKKHLPTKRELLADVEKVHKAQTKLVLDLKEVVDGIMGVLGLGAAKKKGRK